jgi:hypothetical protein
MYFFKVEIAAEIEGDPDSYALYLQSENPVLTQKQVEEHITGILGKCVHSWCRVLYDSLLDTLHDVQEEHGEPMSLPDKSYTESNHPVRFGRGKRFQGNVTFRRLTFATV